MGKCSYWIGGQGIKRENPFNKPVMKLDCWVMRDMVVAVCTAYREGILRLGVFAQTNWAVLGSRIYSPSTNISFLASFWVICVAGICMLFVCVCF
jgi:hypothetical protein